MSTEEAGEDRSAGTVTAENRSAAERPTAERPMADDPPADRGDPADDATPSRAGAEHAKERRRAADRLGQVRGPLALALALILLGAAVTFRTEQLRGSPAAENRALVDTDATARVSGDVSEALTKIFTYSHADTAATERAARDVLAGNAAGQYRALFSQVRREAPAQRLTVTTSVTRAGVIRLSGDTARLLVFLDQVITRGGQGRSSVAAAQLSVTARLQDGHWRIVDIRSR